LAQRGTGSQAAADAANALVAEHQRALSESRTAMERATLRRQAAEAGVFLLDDGTDAGIAYRSLEDVRLRSSQIDSELAGARLDVAAAQAVVDAALVPACRSRAGSIAAS